MASRKFRRALGAVKDQTSISLAKVGNSPSLADLEIAIVKATRHEENPADEKHIREIICLTSYARAYVTACVDNLSKRLNKTKTWTVALKTLMLIQRLLAEGDPAYEQEIFFATRRGTRMLNMSDFRDISRSNSWDYSAFIRTYALYLDERLEFKMQGRRGKRSGFGIIEEEDQDEASPSCARSTPIREMKIERVFSRAQHLQQLLDRFLACRPTGAAKTHRVVIVALCPIVKESFQIYYDMTEILAVLIDRMPELGVADSARVYEIFSRITKQFDELELFYSWSKAIGIARSSEYPEVERIKQKKLDLMDIFVREKSEVVRTRKVVETEPKAEIAKDEDREPEPIEEDMNAIKSLPPPEGFVEAEGVDQEPENRDESLSLSEKEVDLLNLSEDIVTSEEHANRMALALFDDGAENTEAAATAWEGFEGSTDWETALVKSASRLPKQKASLGGGFDKLLLDGMYQQATTTTAMAGTCYASTGSASSVALGSAGKPAMLALPAPPSENDGSPATSADPFAASLGVAPPAYVQMSDMEKKQRLLAEEQMMWQTYARDGMQGQLGLAKCQPDAYNSGALMHRY